ncbi:hypothetical protein AHAS_Ahas03G0066900 [Arachis hypogaea]
MDKLNGSGSSHESKFNPMIIARDFWSLSSAVINHRHCYSHSSASGEESDEKQSFSSKNKFSSRNASSKYDFVKVKVRLGDNADHYYVLSRFSLSRCGWMIMLQCGFDLIPNHVAIKIALELKKLLIDNSLLDVKMASAGLSGTLLSGIGNLSHLRTLLLQNNQLSGPIAAEIGKLSELQTLDLSSNQDLSFNNLSGLTPKILAKGVKKFSLNIKKTGKGVLPKNEKGTIPNKFQNVVCAICNTEQPIGKQQIHCDECEICRVGGQENYFHCKKCGSCYLVTLRDNHLCGELHGHVHY